jgi:hypothetical protein
MSSSSSAESEAAADVDAADAAVERLKSGPLDRNEIIELIAENLGDSQSTNFELLLKINKALREKYSMINLIPDSNKPDAPHGLYIPQLTRIGANKNLYAIALQHESDKKKNQLITYTNGLQEITVDLKNRLMYLPDKLIAQYETDLKHSPGIFGNRFRIILNATGKRTLTSSSPQSAKKKKGGKTRKNKGTPQKKSSAHKTTRKNPKNISQAKK